MKKILLVVVSLLSLHCTKEKSPLVTAPKPQKARIATYELSNIVIEDTTKLSPKKLEILTHFQHNEPINFDDITNEIIRDHAIDFTLHSQQPAKEDEMLGLIRFIEKNISPLSPSDSITTPYILSNIKAQYERAIENYIHGPLLYNKDNVSIFDIIKKHRLQCYSGTIFQLVLMRHLMTPEQYRNSNFVVIFEDGHMLPGFLMKNKDLYPNDQNLKNPLSFNLFGLESTSNDISLIDYGDVTQLSSIINNIRIIDAEYFIISELFKSHIVNPFNFIPEVEEWTARKYGININALPLSPIEPSMDTLTSNWTLFSFGEDKTPSGDWVRTRVTSLIKKSDVINGKISLAPKAPQSLLIPEAPEAPEPGKAPQEKIKKPGIFNRIKELTSKIPALPALKTPEKKDAPVAPQAPKAPQAAPPSDTKQPKKAEALKKAPQAKRKVDLYREIYESAKVEDYMRMRSLFNKKYHKPLPK